MHHKRKRPRTCSNGKSKWMSPATGRRGEAPSWWNIFFNNRPKRRRDARNIRNVMKGADPDGIAWELGNRKPHYYYW